MDKFCAVCAKINYVRSQKKHVINNKTATSSITKRLDALL